MRNFDHYTTAKSLISELESNGYVADALQLRSAMTDGATATEILMALRFHLSEILEKIS